MGHEVGPVIARHGAERMSEAMVMVMGGVGAISAAAVAAKTDLQTRNVFSAPRAA